MPRLSEAKKDVISCDKLWVVANKHLIHRFPNGATLYIEDIESERRQTRGTETSKYPEEKKTKVISVVAASELELAQTNEIYLIGVVGLLT